VEENTVADPATFNFDGGFSTLMKTAGVFGLVGLANYLKASPLPGVKFILPVMLALSLGATGCATRADGTKVSPEGNLALRGTQLVGALNALTVPAGSSPIELLVQNKVLSVQDAMNVARVIQQAMTYAKDLAVVLQAVDEAKTAAERESGLRRAAVLVGQIQNSLSSANVSVGTEAGRKAVLDVLAVAASVLLQVGSLFPPA
jgi:hypothetical protein